VIWKTVKFCIPLSNLKRKKVPKSDQESIQNGASRAANATSTDRTDWATQEKRSIEFHQKAMTVTMTTQKSVAVKSQKNAKSVTVKASANEPIGS
jgi:hypothetical protein